MYYQICSTILNDDLSERVSYNSADFPFYSCIGKLSLYPDYSFISHWHNDVEFIYVYSGSMQYNVNGEIITLTEGNGLFINARQLHYGYSDNHLECEFICILIHPVLLCTTPVVEQQYVTPLVSNTSLPYLLLSKDSLQDRKVLSMLKEMFDRYGTPYYELFIQSTFSSIWMLLCERASLTKAETPNVNSQLSILKHMIHFIHTHYKERISLLQIAKAGGVGKSTCSTIFQKYINQTPINYLINLRLEKSLELMQATDLTITELSLEVGFSGASYYTETFRKHFGCSPKEYQKQHFQK